MLNSLINSMDTVLASDVPALMAQFPAEREDQYRALATGGADTATGFVGVPAPVPTPGLATAPPPVFAPAPVAASGAAPANPFSSGPPAASAVAAPVQQATWTVTPAQQAKYVNIFKTCNPVNGLVSGEAAKGVLLKSRLDYESLGRIWNMSDIDQVRWSEVGGVCPIIRSYPVRL